MRYPLSFRMTCFIVGLLVGLSLNIFKIFHIDSLSLWLFVVFFGLFYSLSFDQKHSQRLLISSVFCALIFIFPVFYMNPYNNSLFGTLIVYLLFFYILQCFHYAWHKENTLRFQYETLFDAVWGTMPVLFISALFFSVAYSLLIGSGEGLDYLGYPFLKNIYQKNPHVFLIVNSVLFYMGIGTARENGEVIRGLRIIMLKMMQFLYPLLGVLATLFFFLYFFSQTINRNEEINQFLLLFAISGVLFFNAYFQDGRVQVARSVLSIYLSKFYQVVFFLVSISAIYTYQKIHSVSQNDALLLYLLGSWSFVYALAALMNTQLEKKIIFIGNILVAWMCILSMLLINNPYAMGKKIVPTFSQSIQK